MDNKRHGINAKIISFSEGYLSYEDLAAIKIKSTNYNLLIMVDYIPVIGEVKGKVTLVGKDYQKEFAEVDGFYMHKSNEFKLLIKETSNVG